MRIYVDNMQSTNDLNELIKMFPPMMRTIQLVTGHSKFYHSAARLSVLFRELANDVIELVYFPVFIKYNRDFTPSFSASNTWAPRRFLRRMPMKP
jgi:hypothetical protein